MPQLKTTVVHGLVTARLSAALVTTVAAAGATQGVREGLLGRIGAILLELAGMRYTLALATEAAPTTREPRIRPRLGDRG